MTIYNLGSINLDYFYHVTHLPKPGETLASTHFAKGLGGKGANQSVALAQGGAEVIHIGQIHHDDEAALSLMAAVGVDLTFVKRGDVPTGHAVVIVEEGTAENQILLMQGANVAITPEMLTKALDGAGPSDWALTQNETTQGDVFLRQAKEAGCQICYSAAPFIKDRVLDLLDIVDLLIVNEGEAEAIEQALGQSPDAWGLPHLIITKGAEGAYYYGRGGEVHFAPSEKVKAVDSTGAGDTYLGFVLAQLSLGHDIKHAMAIASKAAALQVTRRGTADAIPHLNDIS